MAGKTIFRQQGPDIFVVGQASLAAGILCGPNDLQWQRTKQASQQDVSGEECLETAQQSLLTQTT
jgi:hypothetical protein